MHSFMFRSQSYLNTQEHDYAFRSQCSRSVNEITIMIYIYSYLKSINTEIASSMQNWTHMFARSIQNWTHMFAGSIQKWRSCAF